MGGQGAAEDMQPQLQPKDVSNGGSLHNGLPQKGLLTPLLREEPASAREPMTMPKNADIEKQSKPSEGDSSCCTMKGMEMPESFDWHPGGPFMLDTARRSECPGLMFLTYHIGSDLDGKVARTCRNLGVTMPERGKMYDEFQLAVRKVKLEHPWVHNLFLAYCFGLSVILPICFVWWMSDPDYIRSAATALVFELYFLNVFHTRHHQGGKLYKSKLLTRMTTPLYDFMDSTFGYLPYAWWLNHHVKHHVYTNDDDVDTDVPSMWPLLRSCHNQPRLWFHVLQTFYWPLLVPWTALNFPVLNIVRNGGGAFHFVSWLLLLFGVPLYLHGSWGLFMGLFVSGIAGASLAYKFAVSHAHDDLRNDLTVKDDYNDVDAWLSAQIAESMSYGGFFTTVIFGGINMQVEHHLAPALDPPLYYYLAPEIRRISQKYDCKYTSEPSLFHAVWKFHVKLWHMGSCRSM